MPNVSSDRRVVFSALYLVLYNMYIANMFVP